MHSFLKKMAAGNHGHDLGRTAMLHRPYSVLCGKQAFCAALLYITTITTVVSISDRQRASQMPFVPMAWGKRMKEGIKKTNPRNKASTVAGFTRSTL